MVAGFAKTSSARCGKNASIIAAHAVGFAFENAMADALGDALVPQAESSISRNPRNSISLDGAGPHVSGESPCAGWPAVSGFPMGQSLGHGLIGPKNCTFVSTSVQSALYEFEKLQRLSNSLDPAGMPLAVMNSNRAVSKASAQVSLAD